MFRFANEHTALVIIIIIIIIISVHIHVCLIITPQGNIQWLRKEMSNSYGLF